jgi:hypothetical protein
MACCQGLQTRIRSAGPTPTGHITSTNINPTLAKGSG